jgi:hypothetical protein
VKIKFLILVFLVFHSAELIGKNEALNWYFGDKAVLTFNTPDGNPIPLNGSMLSTLEGCSSISDTNGNLLLYTDGVGVWNKKHELLNPKQILFGHYSSSQSALIVQKPKSNNIYYIFTVDAGEYVENIDTSLYENRGLNYSIVDMSLNGGLGAITDYNILIAKPVTEKLSSVFHQNGSDIWILSHEWASKNYLAVLLTEEGIKQTVLSEGAINHSGDPERYIGCMKAAPNGKYVVTTVQGLSNFEISEFDDLSGIVKNSLKISTDNRVENYGIEFSPSSKLLYIADYAKKTLHQFDIANFDTSSIRSSETLIYKDTVSHSLGGLQIAPNGRIYLALNQRKHLACIMNPDIKGEECNFVYESVYLFDDYGIKSRHGLPNLNQSYYRFKGEIDYTYTCQGDPLILKSKVNSDFKDLVYKWTTPNGIITFEKNLVIPNATSKLNGRYLLEVKYRDYLAYDSMDVKIKETPKIKILGDTLICANTKSRLNPEIVSDSLIYIWSTGEKSTELVISSPGKYSLRTIYPDGCSSFDTIDVKGLITNARYKDDKIGIFKQLPIENKKKIVFEFENNDSQPIFINSIFILNETKSIEILNSNIVRGNLESNESKSIEVSLYSKTPESINDSLVIEISSPFCSIYFKVPIFGNIYVPTKVIIPKITSELASQISIPVIAQINTQTESKFDLNFESKISFPSDYFFVDSCLGCTINQNYVLDGKRYIAVTGNEAKLSDDKSILYNLKGTVLIGGEEEGVFEIETVKWSDTLFWTEYTNGGLLITGCSIPLRPIQRFEPTSISIYPNPIISQNVNIKVRTQEIGNFDLILTDESGKQTLLKSWVRNSSNLEEYNFSFGVGMIHSGIHRIILKSPWYILFNSVIIIK